MSCLTANITNLFEKNWSTVNILVIVITKIKYSTFRGCNLIRLDEKYLSTEGSPKLT